MNASSSRPVTVMVSAGEASGDAYGATLVQALRQIDPTVRVWGMGGPLLRRAGAHIVHDPTADSVVGIVEAVKSVTKMQHLLASLRVVMAENPPDVLVLIDFPDFNMRLAEAARGLGVPVVYYFSPSAWAWRRRRARRVAAHATAVCAVMPAERDVYEKAGAPVTYVGHPLIDMVQPSAPVDELRRRWQLQAAGPVIALMPGSRRQEIRTLFEPMVAAAHRLREAYPQARFIVGLAHTVQADWLPPESTGVPGNHTTGKPSTADDGIDIATVVARRFGPDFPVTVVTGHSYDILYGADVALGAMGTITLEAAIAGCPLVGVYKLSPLTHMILKRLYKGRYVALPNIILNRGNTPELIQHEATPGRMAEAVTALLDPVRAAVVREGYTEVVQALGGAGATQRAAQTVWRIAGEGRARSGVI